MGLIKDIKDIETAQYWAAFEYVREDGYKLYVQEYLQRDDLTNYLYIDMKSIFPLKATDNKSAINEAEKILNKKFDFPKIVGIAIFDNYYEEEPNDCVDIFLGDEWWNL